MPASILSLTPQKQQAMVQPPDPKAVEIAENLLIAALYNYRCAVTGEATEPVSYLDVPPIKRECFYRQWAVPVAVEAIWREGE